MCLVNRPGKLEEIDSWPASPFLSWPNFYADSPYKSALGFFLRASHKAFGRVLSITSVLFLLSFGSFLLSPSNLEFEQPPCIETRREGIGVSFTISIVFVWKEKKNGTNGLSLLNSTRFLSYILHDGDLRFNDRLFRVSGDGWFV